MTALLALQRDPDWTTLLWVVIFVGFPLAARLLRWLLTRAGLVTEQDPQAAAEARREAIRRAREERRRAELEGEELWRRLARGESVGPPEAQEAPPARPAPPLRPASEPALAPVERETSLETSFERETSLEREEEPSPLSVLGDVSERAQPAEVSLESEAEPVPLQVLSQPAGALLVPAATGLPRAARSAFAFARSDLRRAVILAEIVGPPACDRPPRV